MIWARIEIDQSFIHGFNSMCEFLMRNYARDDDIFLKVEETELLSDNRRTMIECDRIESTSHITWSRKEV